MPDFFAILAFYYACDEAAMTGALSSEQATFCASAYDTVKVRFLTKAELEALTGLAPGDRAARLRKGYLRFKRWEKDNPDIVAVLRRKALGELA